MATQLITILLTVLTYNLCAQTTHVVNVKINQGDNCSLITGLGKSTFFEVFPNPASKSFTITSDVLNAEVSLTDVQGRVVFNGALTEREMVVDVNDLKWGIYVLKVISNEHSDKIKISIK